MEFNLLFKVTSECNQKCKYCYRDFEKVYDYNNTSIMLNELNKYVKMILNNDKDSLINREFVYSFFPTYEKDVINFSSTSNCKACRNINKYYLKCQNSNNLKSPNFNFGLSGNNKFRYFIGGTRISTYKKSYEKLKKAIKKLNLNVSICIDSNSEFKDILNVYNSSFKSGIINNILFEEQNSYGKGITKEQAFLSVGYELVERISSKY